jgi:hypothetical protein
LRKKAKKVRRRILRARLWGPYDVYIDVPNQRVYVGFPGCFIQYGPFNYKRVFKRTKYPSLEFEEPEILGRESMDELFEEVDSACLMELKARKHSPLLSGQLFSWSSVRRTETTGWGSKV